MENNKSNLGLKVGLGIALVLFLGATFISFNLFNEKKETEAQLTEEKELVMKDLNNMSKQYDLAIQDNEIKNEKLAEAKERIDGLIDSLKVSETNVRSLWRYKQKYLSLQKEMDVLLEENDRLKIENELLATSLDSTKLQLEERSMFTDSLLVQNTELAEVVENASVLQTVDLKGFGVIERTSGKLIPTERARRSDKLRVCFTVAKNTLVQPGDQELYVQVIDPNNNTLGVNEQIQFEEKTLNYSLVSKFNYENTNLNICEFVEPDNDEKFEKGRYTVNVFNKKDLVSTTEFTLR
ncbi:chromosome partitioning protein ParA [Mangrovimonas cancribranchiae]|uniref:Chromosome partitioning protein ParA n=1 Tax=Mangrovimonas cancribranchiae TaxID=3080055 RepID=A0AAU6NZQ6_9FLAO